VHYQPSSATAKTFQVSLEDTALGSSAGQQLIAQGHSATLSATLTDPDGGAALSGKPVSLTLGSGTSAQSCAATSDAHGLASCSLASVSVPQGPQQITAHFAGDAYYQPATSTQAAIVFAYLASGTFVLGDTTAAAAIASGSPVTWWGSQWATQNQLSSGSTAPSAFKGFAATTTTNPPVCGGSWTSTPATSPAPPASVPAYMAVVTTSAITQSGNQITGKIVHIVVIQTGSGYTPDAGHAGIGTIVGQVC
jgi:hypothetical protein